MPFETESIPAIPFLAELREEVLKHSPKRIPKWKFRVAPDIVMQLQPKPTVLLSAAATERGLKPKHQHFIDTAVMMEGVTSEALKQLPKRPCPHGGKPNSKSTPTTPTQTQIGSCIRPAAVGNTQPVDPGGPHSSNASLQRFAAVTSPPRCPRRCFRTTA
jgi:hypothetical protein